MLTLLKYFHLDEMSGDHTKMFCKAVQGGYYTCESQTQAQN